ncbi:nipped-B-like protein A [Staphylotrichum tortipilum]|uniref:Nipped-B-like protein A n=1 Tax=Staphylotrichum tortipilum TaxID=2831512 RepID=A0AAN6MMI8_9PEZI|nr:nipped-B-like protein A [Staphylotrichum longicolle]
MDPSDGNGCALYAELLVNIRQISLAASLPTATTDGASTRVSIASDCSTVELTHGSGSGSGSGNTTARLTLPVKAALGATTLPIPDRQKSTATLSWRLPLDPSSLPPSHQTDDMPWSATDLEAGCGVACRQCGSNIIPAGAVATWKDLPSENWAEMMEFWHCHKPDHHHHAGHEDQASGKADEKSLAARGYGASSAISAQEGVGFVDLTTLLFAETDCRNVTFSPSAYEQSSSVRRALSLPDSIATTQNRNLNVFCSVCHDQLGFFNDRTRAVTLLKWQISCTSTSGVVPGIPGCLAATLISTIARSGSSKSLVTPLPETVHENEDKTGVRDAIHIWVLNSSIVYSSSAVERPTPAIKLLYRPIPRGEADKMLEAVTCDAQEINLPAHAVDEVIRCLEASNALLPPMERMLKEWKVGLLTRWENQARTVSR